MLRDINDPFGLKKVSLTLVVYSYKPSIGNKAIGSQKGRGVGSFMHTRALENSFSKSDKLLPT